MTRERHWEALRRDAGSPLPTRSAFSLALLGFLLYGIVQVKVVEIVAAVLGLVGTVAVVFLMSKAFRNAAGSTQHGLPGVLPSQRLGLWLMGVPDTAEPLSWKLLSAVIAVEFVAVMATMGS